MKCTLILLKTLVKQRFTNLFTAQDCYFKKQNKVLINEKWRYNNG